jgi:energy-coupling factor transport system substrate-specific component
VSTSVNSKRPINSALLIPIGIALNLALGTVVHLLKLPIFLDAVGTIVVTLLGGVTSGIITGVGSFVLAGVLVNPAYPWFSGTQVVIAVFARIVAVRSGYKTVYRRIVFGLLLGVVTGIVSAPVTAFLFGGISGSGASLITAYLMATGKKVVQAVILSGLASEPLDKLFQTLLAYILLRGAPPDILSRFDQDTLKKNGLLK